MNLTIEVYPCCCSLSKFEINGIEADDEDFGEQYDHAREEAEDCCCGNMKFEPKPATTDILNKYKITLAEYNQICEKLDCLSFGRCAWCE